MNQQSKPLNIREFMMQWNLKFPLDRWWRERHGIAFGSPAHREANFIDMAFEFVEFRYFNKKVDDLEDLRFTEDERKGLGIETPLAKAKEVKMTQKEINDEFDNLNLDDFNDK